MLWLIFHELFYIDWHKEILNDNVIPLPNVWIVFFIV